jgi:spore coat protein CotH
MPKHTTADRRRRARSLAAAIACLSVAAAVSCTTPGQWWPTTTTTVGTGPTPPTTVPSQGLLDSSRVHSIAVTYDQAEYDEMIGEYVEKGDKDWIHASITIDGTTFEDIGIRLKGNSSIMHLRFPGGAPRPGGPGGDTTAQTPERLPWLVRFDKYVDGQQIGGRTEIVVRSNPTKTALNEAVSLELLGQTGLATQYSAPYRFTVNGTRTALRLVTEVPGDEWDRANFDNPGILYKAESGGDYSYRGEDPEAYDEIFDQETGDKDDLQPLIDFLKFINQSTDADFAAQLPAKFDIQTFADYLAFEDLIGNWDDIEGPGNNSYLRWDTGTGSFTIVAWDHNLAMGGMGDPPPTAWNPWLIWWAWLWTPPANIPTTTTNTTTRPTVPGAPTANTTTTRPAVNPGFLQGNLLVRRFKAVPVFKARYDASMRTLRTKLYANGNANAILQRRADVLRAGAAGLVDANTIATESATVASFFKPTP